MAKDFYKILGIQCNASEIDIKTAYRKLAIKFHPDKNRSPHAEERFKEISKAYAILSDFKQRALYDLFLERGHDSKILVNVNKFKLHTLNIPKNESKEPQYQPDNVHEVFVSLNEIDKGSVRKIKISRTITNSDNETYSEEKVFNILIRRGLKTDTKIIFRHEGNRIAGKPAADVIFIVRDKPHALFKREGADIKYFVHISLKEALCGTVVQVPTLQGNRVLVTTQNEIILPHTLKRIAQRGLPMPKEPNKRGDLLIEFHIDFPESLSVECKNQLARLLANPK